MSVRVVGRVERYDASSNQALLSEPNNNAVKLLVDARLTDSDNFQPGSLVMLIGELSTLTEDRLEGVHENRTVNEDLEGAEVGEVSHSLKYEETHKDIASCQNLLILTARVSKCVDRLDYKLYAQAVRVWRDLREAKYT
ncbi:hypothetical protein EGW08_022606 [Elysia chlorotica]|uniref:Uncharacterized protein n=1 Tax=Elysia chlorotica TaxID=188477 RepID=A0A433SKE2_ELYCH|nr:hypothetical protein EGW08_022606 [Elysia chlorotica]